MMIDVSSFLLDYLERETKVDCHCAQNNGHLFYFEKKISLAIDS